MELSSAIRILVVGGAVVAALGSATSNQPQPSFFTTPPPPAGTPPAPPPAPTTAAAPNAATCDAACARVAACDVTTFDVCMQDCRANQVESTAEGPAQLAAIAGASCAQLTTATEPAATPEPAPAPEPSPAPPVAPAPAPPTDDAQRTQWVCSATGYWQKCDTKNMCFTQMQTSMGFGATEPAAATSAQSMCTSAMSRMMSVNFTYRTRVTSICRKTTCSPPNAK